MTLKKHHIIIILSSLIIACNPSHKDMKIEIYETSESGNKLSKVKCIPIEKDAIQIDILPNQKFQEIYGFEDHSQKLQHIS